MSAGFAWVFISMLVYGALHSALASLRFKDWVLKRLGHGRYRYYRLFFSLSAGLTLLPVLALAAALPDGQLYAIPSPWMFLTLAVQIAAGLCFLLALTQTGTSDFLGVGVLFRRAQADQPQHLATGGFYRRVRHPLYFFGLVILWLTPLLTWNLLALNLGGTIYILAGAWLEERKLLTEFGEAYADYRRRTPFIIPWPKTGK